MARFTFTLLCLSGLLSLGALPLPAIAQTSEGTSASPLPPASSTQHTPGFPIAPTCASICIGLNHVSALAVANRFHTSVADGGLKELLPEGVASIHAINGMIGGMNVLLVGMNGKGNLKEEIEELRKLATMLDVAKGTAMLEFKQIRLPQTDGAVLLKRMTVLPQPTPAAASAVVQYPVPAGGLDPRPQPLPADQNIEAIYQMSNDEFTTAIAQLVAQGKAVTSPGQRFLADGDQAPTVFDLRKCQTTYAGVLLKSVCLEGKGASCELLPVLSADPTAKVSPSMKIPTGVTILFEKTDTPGTTTLTFLTLTSIPEITPEPGFTFSPGSTF